MRKLPLICITLALLLPFSAGATASSVDRIVDHIEPLIKTDYIKGSFFVGSTTATSTFAGGLNLTGGCFAVNNTCLNFSNLVTSVFGRTGVVTALSSDYSAFYQPIGSYATFGYPFPGNATSTVLTFNAGPIFSNLGLGTVNSTAGGQLYNTATTSVASGTGISLSANPGALIGGSNLTITNTGVTSIVAGSNISISGATGAVTINATGGGTGSGLSTTSPISDSNLLEYSIRGAGSAYGVATSTLSASSPLTGSFTQIGSGGSLGIQVANTSQNGYLSSTDWNTFNGKQTAITGTQGQNIYIGPGGTPLATSSVFEDTTGFVGVGTTTPAVVLHVVGTANDIFDIQNLVGPSNFDLISGDLVGNTENAYWKIGAQTTGNFQVRDAKNLATPFVIQGATPTNTLVVASTGRVGIGSSTPTKQLSVGATNTGTFAISTSTSGCAQFSPFGELYSTGANCGSGTGTNFWTSLAGNIYNNTGARVQFPAFDATSTTATSTVTQSLTIGSGSSAPLVQIGSTTPTYGYLVNDRLNIIDARNDYSADNSYNLSAGNCATADKTEANDLNSTALNFFDMGHTSSGFTGVGCANNPFTGFGANSSYLFDPSGNMNFALGSTTGGSFNWFSGGYATTNKQMTLLNNGYLGLGTTSPFAQFSLATSGPAIALKDLTGGGNTFLLRSGSTGFNNFPVTGDFDIYDVSNKTSMIYIQNAGGAGNGEVMVGTSTNGAPSNNSRLFIFGGANGANIDTQGDPNQSGGFGDTTSIEAEGSDYNINGGVSSISLRYYGPKNPAGTYLGYTQQRLGILDFGAATTSIISTGINLIGQSSDLIFGNGYKQTAVLSGSGKLGIGTTSPYAKLSVFAADVGSKLATTTLFAVGSSTASATTTLFSINNTGVITTSLSTGLVKSNSGVLGIGAAGSDYQAPISLTTTGTGAATFISNTLNIPTPSGGSGTVTNVATDATLTGGPITTTGTLGINLTNPNTWTGLQQFSSNASTTIFSTTGSALLDTGGSPGVVSIASSSPSAESNAGLLQVASQNSLSAYFAGNVGIGTFPTTGNGLNIGGTYSTSGMVFTPTISIPSTFDGVAANIADTAMNITSGVHANVATMKVSAPTGSVGSGSITNAYSLWIASTPTYAGSNYGLYQQGTGMNYFQGNVGVGTTTPAYPLEVAAGNGQQIVLSDGTASSNQWAMRNAGGTLYIGTSSPSTFATSTISAVSITSQATTQLGVGTTTPWRTLSVTGTVGFDGLTAAAGTVVGVCFNSVTKELEINTITNCTVSSRRYKHDINYLDTGGLSVIEALKPASFMYNGNTFVEDGFIAEDVAAVAPQLAGYDKQGLPSAVDDIGIDAQIVLAIQQQQKEIEAMTGHTVKSAEDNWQWIAIAFLFFLIVLQQVQIRRLKV